MATAPTTVPVLERGYSSRSSGWWQLGDLEETTPELRWPLSVRVFDAMRRQDAQVASVLRAMTLPVRRTTWRVDGAGCRPDVAQLVSEDLGLPLVGQQPTAGRRTRDRFSWSEHVALALLSQPLGHMFFEQVYRYDAQGRARLRKLGPRMPRTISAVNVASDGGLVSIEQWPTATSAQTIIIPAQRLVAYVQDREGGDWLGHSVLRAAYKNWLIKDRLLRVQAQTIERNGMGVPLYKAGDNESDLGPGRALAEAWRAGDAAGAAVPPGADLVLRGVEGRLPDADPAIRYQDEQIARAVLAHFLNLGTETGSWALGSTFADFFTMSLQTVAQQIADVATMHVVEDLVDANWGPDEPAPRIVFDEIGSRQAPTAEAISLLLNSGAFAPDPELEAWLRQHYGLPMRDPAVPWTAPARQQQMPTTTGGAP